MEKIRVLFVCTHNSARSVMAETFLNSLGKGRFHAESAGLEPRETHPLVIRVMKEEGYDLEGRRGNSIFEYFKEGRLYDYVVYVCASEDEERCPVFPGVRKSLHWPFPDPSKLQGSEKLNQVRSIRDQIKSQVEKWIHEITCVFRGATQ